MEDHPYRYSAAGALMFAGVMLAISRAPGVFIAVYVVTYVVVLLDLILLAAFGRGIFPDKVTED